VEEEAGQQVDMYSGVPRTPERRGARRREKWGKLRGK